MKIQFENKNIFLIQNDLVVYISEFFSANLKN